MSDRTVGDRWVVVTALVLCGVGLVSLYSSSSWITEFRMNMGAHVLVLNQAIKALLGVAVMLAVSRLDYRRLGGRWAWIAWAGVVALLLLLVVPGSPFKQTIRQTDRWLRLGPVMIQPSEFARIAMIVLAASVVARVRTWSLDRNLMLLTAAVSVPVLLVLLQPNFGTAMAMGLSALLLLVAAGVPWRWLLGSGAGLVAAAGALTAVYPYPRGRIQMWFDGIRDFNELTFQIKQGLIALGSGGTFGVGLGQSLQKRQFVPDPHTDLILAIIGEELGFIGLLALLGLFGILVWRGFVIAHRAPDRLGYLIAVGVSIQFALYVLINAGVVTGLMPVTGLPLPFVSYGGSALIANLVSIGLLLSVARTTGWMGARRQRRVLSVEF